ncbi:MAG TPA: MBL fold metallo-hydrolase [Thermoanaerobaculia bacterium]|nr:MBL fold metallo-hydrolase [Thermoanaerobaculia bacterium]
MLALILAATLGFHVEKVSDGVYAAVRNNAPGLGADATSVFIINDEDVVVVDTTGSLAGAREELAALRKLTSKPVRYVINTHWHFDHVTGNQIYREAFPGAEIIASAAMREDMATKAEKSGKEMAAGLPQFIKDLRELLEKKQNFAGEPINDAERKSYESDIAQAEGVVAEANDIRITLPTIAIDQTMTLHRGKRTIEIRQLGRSHTRGDIIVWLPEEKIAITGDLVAHPVPLMGSDQSYISDWGASLEKLKALQPRVIVPGHGELLRDDKYVTTLIGLTKSLVEQAKAAVARGEKLEDARKTVNVDEYRKAIAGDDRLLGFIFRVYVRNAGFAAAYREASTPAP